MRWLIPILFAIVLMSGCKGDHPWRDEHRGILKDVRGSENNIVLVFDEGKMFKIPFSMVLGGDEWKIGDEVVLQDMSDRGGWVHWRMVSPSYTRVLEEGAVTPKSEKE